jgi:hypothetical protein
MSATIHSERHGGELHLGAINIDAAPHPDFVPFTSLRAKLKAEGTLPTIPQMFGHGHSLPQGAWRMLGNGPDDTVFPGFGGAGDCVIAGGCHEEMEAALCAKRPLPQFGGATAIKQYGEAAKRQNGQAYDPKTGEGDTGLDPQEELKHRQEVGLYDDAGTHYKIGQVVTLTPGDILQHWEATYLLENSAVCINVQEAQEQQFNESTQPTWEYVPGSNDIGGHYVPAMGRIGLLSWAEDVYYTPNFLRHQQTAGYAYADPLRYNVVTGETAEHWKDQDIEKFLVLIARTKAAA